MGDSKIIGIGSNIRPRKENIEKAIRAISVFANVRRISPIYETPAVLPTLESEEWNLPFLNLVIEIDFTESAFECLKHLKRVENEMGRKNSARWSPRVIDLDILLWGDETIQTSDLQVPHPELIQRSFVLDPLKDLIPSMAPAARKLPGHQPLFMAVVNLTPDSFSDGGVLSSPDKVIERVQHLEEQGVPIIDFGAESTRPGASIVSEQQEISRLAPIFEPIHAATKKSILKPLWSLDTCSAKVAKWSQKYAIDIINDVSGLKDKDMPRFLADSSVEYVLTHSLGVPANKEDILKSDPVKELCFWLEDKLSLLDRNSISLDRVYFDPGIGFGKNALQSLEILKCIEEFHKFPVRLLVGHSRKSFMRHFSPSSPDHRDLETLGISFQLMRKGVDVLRVHNPDLHLRALKGWSHVAS